MCNQCERGLAVMGVDMGRDEGMVSSIQAYSTTISSSRTGGLSMEKMDRTMEKYRKLMADSMDYNYMPQKYFVPQPLFDEDKIRDLMKLVMSTAEDRRKAREDETIKQQENDDKMNIRQELRKLTKGEDQVLLEEAGLVDETGDLTEAGEEEVTQRLFKQVKDELVADLKKIKAKRDKSKKSE